MRVTLAWILAHPCLAEADPVVRAGATAMGRRVRWIHSSEVLEIAPLLRGGELLLTGGEMLHSASEPEQRRYVRELAQRQVAGVAIETGSRLLVLPPAVLTEADSLDFPVVELRRRVPFVGVAEAVNAELVNDSVTLLRYGGELAHALSGILSNGGGVQALLDELGRRSGTPIALFDGSGQLITNAGAQPGHVLPPAALGGVTSRVTVRGAHAATLAFYPGPDTDLDVIGVAGERAVEALALALLRTNPPSARDFAASELAHLASRASEHRARIMHLGQVVGFKTADPVIAIAIAGSGTSWGFPGLHALLRQHGQVAMDTAEQDARVLVSLSERHRAAEVRCQLIQRLQGWAVDYDGLVVVVGPVVFGLDSVSASMGPAEACLERRSAYGGSVVVDSATTMVTDWLGAPESRMQTSRFVHGQLAMLLGLGRSDGDVLMETLEVYFDSGCNKTRAAQALHLQRQSLYGRLDRAFRLIGGDPTGTDRVLALHLALKLRHGLHLDKGAG